MIAHEHLGRELTALAYSCPITQGKPAYGSNIGRMLWPSEGDYVLGLTVPRSFSTFFGVIDRPGR